MSPIFTFPYKDRNLIGGVMTPPYTNFGRAGIRSLWSLLQPFGRPGTDSVYYGVVPVEPGTSDCPPDNRI